VSCVRRGDMYGVEVGQASEDGAHVFNRRIEWEDGGIRVTAPKIAVTCRVITLDMQGGNVFGEWGVRAGVKVLNARA
jgi:hypothetical protein